MNKKTKLFLLEFAILVVICSFNHRLLFGLLWVILHELAHILTSKRFGTGIFSIELHLTGARGDIQGVEDLSRREKMIVYSSGAVVNIIIAITLFFISKYIDMTWIMEGVWINLGLVIFNMLPAYPLDGARIYELIIGEKLLYKTTKNILVKASFIISGILIVLFFLTVYIHKANLSLLLAAILITYSAVLEKKNTMYILMGNLFKKRRRLVKKEYIENKNISIYYKSNLLKALSLVDGNKFNCFYILNDVLELLGIIYEDELMEGLKKYGNISFAEYLEKNKKG